MKKLKLINPATGEIMKELPEATGREITSKVAVAGKARQKWKNLPYRKRASYLEKFRTLLGENKKSIAETISLETGKPLHEAMFEAEKAVKFTDWFIKNTGRELKPKKLQENVSLQKEPVGVVAVITPWNLPFLTPLWIIPPALLTGNTVVFKPSELSPLSGMKLLSLFRKAGLPAGCLNLLVGGDKVGKKLVKSDIDKVAFIGSQEAGKDVMRKASQKLHRLAFEMGGKDPLIVCRDSDLKKAAAGAVRGSLLNCGQLCASVERIYVEKGVYSEFIKLVIGEVNGYGEIGPLSNPNQLKIVKTHLNDSLRKGARILLGGRQGRRKGYYFEPTVVVGVNHSMKIMNEETFGPVIAIMKVDNVREAIRLSNSLHYGLCASVYSKNIARARKIAGQLQAGIVCINSTPIAQVEFPWGGVKQSSMGRMLSVEGINEFLQTKVVQVS